MKRIWFTLSLAITTSVLSGGLFYTALKKSYPDWSQLNLIDTAMSIVVALLSGVAAGLFLRGVRSYKAGLQRSYKILCIGIVLFGVAQAQYPIASYINATFWYLDGFISLPYLFAAAFIFWGVRSLARILEIDTRWASWLAVLTTAVASAPIVSILPHAASDYGELQIVVGNGLTTIDAVFLFFSIMTLVFVRRSIAKMYTRALTWLMIALGVNIVAGLHYIMVNLLFARRDNWYFFDSVSIWPFFAGAVLLVCAGYAMVLVGQRADAQTTTDLPEPEAPVRAELPLVDIIVYMADLVSKPQEIDPTLDALRRVTSQLEEGQKPGPAEERQLIGVYRALETYLSTKERLRAFTPDELRRLVTREFNLDPATAGRLWKDDVAPAPKPAAPPAPVATVQP